MALRNDATIAAGTAKSARDSEANGLYFRSGLIHLFSLRKQASSAFPLLRNRPNNKLEYEGRLEVFIKNGRHREEVSFADIILVD